MGDVGIVGGVKVVVIVDTFALVTLAKYRRRGTVCGKPDCLVFSSALCSLPIARAGSIFGIRIMTAQDTSCSQAFTIRIIAGHDGTVRNGRCHVLSRATAVGTNRVITGIPVRNICRGVRISSSLNFALQLVVPRRRR